MPASFKLTKAAVDRYQLPAGKSDVTLWDADLAGFAMRVHAGGRRTWGVSYRARSGQQRRVSLGRYPEMGADDARKAAKAILGKVAEGADPAGEARAARAAEAEAEPPAPVHDIFDRVLTAYIEHYAKPNTREKSWRETERILKKEALPAWKGKRIGDITRQDVQSLLEAVVDRGSPIMANRVLAAVRKLFAWVAAGGPRGFAIDRSPCENIKPPAAERSRDRVMTDAEIRVLWRAFDGLGFPFGPLLKFLLVTGQRREEVAGLPWSEIDLEARLWTLPRERAKNNVQHGVPLSPEAVSILSSLPRRGDLVFSTTGQTPPSGFSKIKTRVDKSLGEAVPWTWHDFRRTAASGMAGLGVALPVIEKLLNHTSGSFGGIVSVYQRYQFADEKRAALELWGAHVTAVISKKVEDENASA